MCHSLKNPRGISLWLRLRLRHADVGARWRPLPTRALFRVLRSHSFARRTWRTRDYFDDVGLLIGIIRLLTVLCLAIGERRRELMSSTQSFDCTTARFHQTHDCDSRGYTTDCVVHFGSKVYCNVPFLMMFESCSAAFTFPSICELLKKCDCMFSFCFTN